MSTRAYAALLDSTTSASFYSRWNSYHSLHTRGEVSTQHLCGQCRLNIAGSLFRAVQGSVQDAVTKFDTDIKYMIENVDWGAAASYQSEAREQHGEIKNMIKNLGSKLVNSCSILS